MHGIIEYENKNTNREFRYSEFANIISEIAIKKFCFRVMILLYRRVEFVVHALENIRIFLAKYCYQGTQNRNDDKCNVCMQTHETIRMFNQL